MFTYVVDDNGIRSLQIDPQSTSPRAQQESKIWAPRSIEVFNRLLPHIARHISVQSLEEVSSHGHVVAQNIEHPDHLREDEDTMAICLEASEEFVQ